MSLPLRAMLSGRKKGTKCVCVCVRVCVNERERERERERGEERGDEALKCHPTLSTILPSLKPLPLLPRQDAGPLARVLALLRVVSVCVCVCVCVCVYVGGG